MRDFDPTLKFSVLSDGPLLPRTPMTEAQREAEMAVEQRTSQEIQAAARESATKHRHDDSTMSIKDQDMTENITPPSAPTNPLSTSSFPFPSGGSSSSSSTSHTPIRRRSGAPGMIPNFPSAMAPRDPPPFFSSPSSPPEPSTSPPSRAFPSMALPRQPFSGPGYSPASSPWTSLAAASGAPTPSLDGPGRNSPHLGYPFEQLNIGGSWSGGNLWGEGSTSASPAGPTAGRKRSFDVGMDIDPSAPGSAPTRRVSTDPSHRDPRHSSGGLSTSPSHRPSLPAALAKRRASLPKNVLGATLSPATLTSASKAPSPLAASSTSTPSPNAGLKPLPASKLGPLISQSTTLILDLRPPSAYRDAHLPDSHSVSVPSTLLRRPAFNLEKLAGMLSSEGKEAVSKWRETDDVVLLDGDSTSVPANSTLEGVATKFDREGYKGNLWFVRGGFASVRMLGIELVSEDQDDDSPTPSTHTGGLMAGKLGKLAFQQGSTGSNLQNKSSPDSTVVPTTPGFGLRGNYFGSHPNTSSTERPTLVSSKSGSSRSSSSMGRLGTQMEALGGAKTGKFQPANPFFDNIRQDLELSHGGESEKIALNLPSETIARSQDLPLWLADLTKLPKQDCAERLAEEFFRVELGEQKRLQAIMDWHSKTSGAVVVRELEDQKTADQRTAAKLTSWAGAEDEGEDYFPYSITAGIERGTKNRYKNIWPYDFARVRLESPPDQDGDYINASFVQPMGTSRRYIATQGPLESTYRDFWMLVWEQGVSVIVMLTKQYDGGSIKCGNYWEEKQYGPIKLHLESKTGGEDIKPDLSSVSGFDFGTASTPSGDKDTSETPQNIKRTFVLTREDKDLPPRKVVQIQCCSWPDFDVPESPSILLDLLRDVDDASTETCKEDPHDRAEHPPVLVHCSAGVGRTGSFIIVDAILDALRRERDEQFAGPTRQSSQDTTDSSTNERLLHATPLHPLKTSTPVQSMLKARGGSAESGGGRSFGSGGSPSSGYAAARTTSFPDSTGHGTSHSGESSKSVSFLVPPKTSNPASNESLPSVFGQSSSPAAPGPLATAAGKGAVSIRPEHRRSQDPMTNAIPALESQAEKMDVDQTPQPQFDPSEDAKRKTIFDNLFTKHRSGTPTSMDSVDDSDPSESAARPSLLASDRGSSGNVSQVPSRSTAQSDLIHGIPRPTPIVKSLQRHRKPSPLIDQDGLSPVAVVLEGMRTQRMSLVQSLRQYVFVHRAIIQGYLNMVDEDRRRGREKSMTNDSAATTTTTNASTTDDTTETNSVDDDSNQKRRASPTELVPENAQAASAGATGLAKRPSFKKMRPASRSGTALRDLTPSSAATSDTPEIPEEAIVIDTGKHSEPKK